MKIFRFMIAIAAGVAVVSCTSHTETPTPEATDVPSKQAAKGEKAEDDQKDGAQEDADKQSPVEEQTTGDEAVVPTDEQQAAAEHLLSGGNEEGMDELPAPVASEEVLEDEVVPNTSGIPGRNALRMGQYVPPEEAASAGSAQPLRPNRAEQHGFRSPSLPTRLPMDINGKLTGEGKN